MPDDNRRSQAEEIRQYLQTLFGFSDHEYKVIGSGEPEAFRMANSIYLKRKGRNMTDADDFPSSCYSCSYTGDIDGIDSEYVIFLGAEDDGRVRDDNGPEAGKGKKPLIRLAEEITHGEHMAEHVPRVGSYDKFLGVYSGAYTETVGNLGARAFHDYLWRKDGEWLGIRLPEIEIALRPDGEGVIMGSSLDHHFGYSFAEQIMESGVPLFRNLFWAKNQRKGWKSLKKSINPRIKLEREVWTGLRPGLKKYFKKIGIKPKVLVLG